MSFRKLKDIDTESQPREKLKLYGVQSLSDVELLAIMLRSGIQGKNVLELSSEIMEWASGRWSTLTNLTLNDMNSLFKGMGDVKAMQLLAALEVGRRRSVEMRNVQRIESYRDVVNVLYRHVADLDVEQFWCIFLSNANRIIALQRISSGGLTGVAVDVRVVLRMALSYNATGIVLAHNHPSGSLKPSEHDVNITEKLSRAAALMDIRLVDHVILSSDPDICYSFVDNGLL